MRCAIILLPYDPLPSKLSRQLFRTASPPDPPLPVTREGLEVMRRQRRTAEKGEWAGTERGRRRKDRSSWGEVVEREV